MSYKTHFIVHGDNWLWIEKRKSRISGGFKFEVTAGKWPGGQGDFFDGTVTVQDTGKRITPAKHIAINMSYRFPKSQFDEMVAEAKFLARKLIE